jgi:beta-lactamase superfamily II metal-dependent hydrolase
MPATRWAEEMAEIFRIELLPARHGDSLLLEYGDAERPRRVLIDGGPVGAWDALSRRLSALPVDQRSLELLVITHVDSDHIEGCFKLLNHPELATFGDIWFNGWPHVAQVLREPEPEAARHKAQRSILQGTEIAVRIQDRDWNAAFEGGPIFVPASGALPVRELAGGLRLTILSPNLEKLEKLRTAWGQALERAALDPDDEAALEVSVHRRPALRGAHGGCRPSPDEILSSAALAMGPLDNAVANGSSIAMLAEYRGRRIALLGDAHMPPVVASLARLAQAAGEPRLRLDAVKMAHHGSSGNLSESFLRGVQCRDWLVSTDGSIFGHPDEEALHAVVRHVRGARLMFNYRSSRNACWDGLELRQAHGHEAFYPRDAARGIALDLMTGVPA